MPINDSSCNGKESIEALIADAEAMQYEDTLPSEAESIPGRIRDVMVGRIHFPDELTHVITQMSGDVPPLEHGDVMGLLLFHLRLGLAPLMISNSRHILPGYMRPLLACGVAYLCAEQRRVVQAAGFDPIRLSIGAYRLVTTPAGPLKDSSSIDAAIEQMKRNFSSPYSWDFHGLDRLFTIWQETVLAAAEHEGPQASGRVAQVVHWNQQLTRILSGPVFPSLKAVEHAIRRAAKRRKADSVLRDGAEEVLQEVWARLDSGRRAALTVWFIGDDKTIHADGASMLDLIGINADSRDESAPGSDLIDAHGEVGTHALQPNEAGPTPPEQLILKEAMAIFSAAALEELDQRDLELAWGGHGSRRDRARQLKVSPGTLKKHEAKVIARVERRDPVLARVLSGLYAA